MTIMKHSTRFPLTPTQRDIYLDQELHPHLLIYSVGGAVELGSGIDRTRWETAAAEVFRNDPGLCSRLVVDENGGLSQEPSETARIVFGQVEDTGGRSIEEVLRKLLNVSYDWTSDELFHHWFVKMADGAVYAVLGMPHIFSDGHTVRLFFERTAGRYTNPVDPLPEVTSFYDYMREHPAAEPQTPLRDEWSRRMKGVGPFQSSSWADELPGKAVNHTYSIAGSDAAAVATCCRLYRVHPANLFLRCFALVMSQFREGNEDFLTLSIRDARPEKFNDVTGCFYHVMPQRIVADTLCDNVPIRTFLKPPKLPNLPPLPLMELNPMMPGGTRLIFNYYDFDTVEIFGQPRRIHTWFSHRPDEVHLIVTGDGEGYDLRFRSHSSEFRYNAIVERMALVIRQISEGAAVIGDLDWLLPEEKETPRLTDTSAAPDVLARFAGYSRLTPDAIALTEGDSRWSYAELDVRANSLAARLCSEGVEPGDRVALFLGRGAMQVVAILAVLKTGAAYVPVDPDYPLERVQLILQDATPRCVLSDGALPDALASGSTVLDVRQLQDSVTEFETCPYDPAALAYIIYTSGSTGRPKGVEVTRHNMARLFTATEQDFQFGPEDVGLLLHSYAFDFSVWEIWSALAYGGRLVMVPRSVVRDPEAVLELIDREGVTLLNQTPSAFALLAGIAAGRQTQVPGRLRHIIFGGEMLSPAQVKSWFDAFGGAVRLTNMYGITETTVHVTAHEIMRGERYSDIGRPLCDLCIRLVSPSGRAVPTGVAGEIWVGGAGLALGYHHLPEETITRFVEAKFWEGRAYRSGDRARLRGDGSLEYLGRIDHQVQVRGYRVELGEIEVALAGLGNFRQVLVLDFPDIGLVAYLETDDEPEAEVLKRQLALQLPDYMLPARFVAVQKFPLTAHGKIDRALLPRPGVDAGKSAGGFRAPEGTAQIAVAKVFSEVLGIDAVGADDDFFALGGNSLSATMVALRVREVLSVSLSLAAIFQHRTPGELAAHLGGGSVEPSLEVAILPDRTCMPLTFPQERVWLIESLNPDSLAYHFQALMHFYGKVNLNHVIEALHDIIARHEIFRTCFRVVDGRAVQHAVKEWKPDIPVINLAEMGVEAAQAEFKNWCNEHFSTTFSIDRLPLVEWALFVFPGDKTTLVHREHHLLHDGWSFVLFIGEFLERYSALAEARSPELRPLTYQCGDFAAAHRAWMDSGEGEHQLKYWRAHLHGFEGRPPLLLDRARPPQLSYSGGTLRITLAKELTQNVSDCAKREGVTQFGTMLAAFAALLCRSSGETEFCIGSGVANRRFPGTENLIGMLLNNLPLRINVQKDAPFSSLLKEVGGTLVGALDHQDVPYDRIVHAWGGAHDPRTPPLCQIFFSSYDGPLPEAILPGVRVVMEPGLANGSAKFDLNVIVVSLPSADGGIPEITMLWEFRTALFERATIERMAERYFRLLDELCREPARSIAGAGLEDAAQTGAAVPVAYPGPSVHRVFESVVHHFPEAVAVVEDGTETNYAALNRRANKLAACLVSHAVGPGNTVGIFLPRGTEALVVMLAILKTGAAYLPLDVAYPKGRLRVLLESVKPLLTVTREAHEARLPAGTKTLNCDALPGNLTETNLTHSGALTDPAYTIFTSGSTGEPKGVDIPHRGILRLVFAEAAYKLGADERILQLAPMTFDASVFEIWGALLNGGTCVIAPNDVPTPESLGEMIKSGKVSTLWLTASLFNTMIDARPEIFRPLRQLLTGGEALSVPHVCRALKALPDVNLINGYGPTESTTFATTFLIPPDFARDRLSVPIGRPLSNTAIRILDAAGHVVPVGVVGDLMIGGDGLALGYRNSDEANSLKFFEWKNGERLYRSGDKARWLNDGSIEFLGRDDDQMKVRGFRIEPGEVESAMMSLPGVERAVLLRKGDELFAAFTGEADPVSLRKPLSRLLPGYLVPSRFIPVDTIPVTANGKIDRNALINMAETLRSKSSEKEDPIVFSNMHEPILARIFERVLGCEGIKPEDDFFDAGGHSLLALELLAKIRASLGVDLPVRALFEAPTVRSLAKLIEAGSGEREWSGSLLQVKPGGDKPPIYFTPGGDGGEGSFLVYAGFVRDLPDTQPFYGFVARGVDNELPMHDSVEAMARDYISEIRRHQPDGPFILAGECLGGVVAFEMARQLCAAGEDCPKLLILDGYPPDRRRRRRHRIWSTCVAVRRWTQGKPGAALLSRLLPYSEEHAPATVRPEWLAYQRTLLRHVPERLDGEVHVIRSVQQIECQSESGWEPFTKRVITHQVPGDHFSYIREHVAVTASILKGIIEPS